MQLSVTAASMDLFPIPTALSMYATKTRQCTCNNLSRLWSCCATNSIAWHHHNNTDRTVHTMNLRLLPLQSLSNQFWCCRLSLLSQHVTRLLRPVGDCWGRLSYCLFHITAQQYSYMYCWDVNPPLPQLHWTCFLPRWHNLCMRQIHANARRTTTIPGWKLVASWYRMVRTAALRVATTYSVYYRHSNYLYWWDINSPFYPNFKGRDSYNEGVTYACAPNTPMCVQQTYPALHLHHNRTIIVPQCTHHANTVDNLY